MIEVEQQTESFSNSPRGLSSHKGGEKKVCSLSVSSVAIMDPQMYTYFTNLRVSHTNSRDIPSKVSSKPKRGKTL